MARIRSLKPDHGTHRKVGPLSDRAYRVWVAGLITQADDEGRLRFDLDEIRTKVFGYHPAVKARHIAAAVQELLDRGLAVLYEAEGGACIEMHDWQDHQAVSHPTPSRLPAPPEDSGILRSVPEASRTFPGEGRKERKGEEGRKEGGEQEASGAGDRGAAPAGPGLSQGNGNLDPELAKILGECPHLALIATPTSAAFWDRFLAACQEYPQADSRWVALKLRKWDQYFASNPAKRSKERPRLEQRLMGWLARDLEGLARAERGRGA